MLSLSIPYKLTLTPRLLLCSKRVSKELFPLSVANINCPKESLRSALDKHKDRINENSPISAFKPSISSMCPEKSLPPTLSLWSVLAVFILVSAGLIQLSIMIC